MTLTDKPDNAERFFFENNGYLVLERLLSADHVCALREELERVVTRRREQQAKGIPHTGMTDVRGEDTRIFYILEDSPLFLELLDSPRIMPYVTGLLNSRPHHHASDAIVERGLKGRGMGWHIDGHDEGYRGLRGGSGTPLLQLKVGYYLSDMTEPGRGNLCVIPGSHKTPCEPDPQDLQKTDLFPGAVQICAPPGSAILFHNALWHSHGPWTRDDGARIMLYYAYEHPWMMASAEHWGYSRAFHNSLSPERRKLFHGFVFDPPEYRWG